VKHLCWTGAAVGRTVLAVQAPDPIAMKLTVYAPFSRMYVVHLLPLLFATAVASLQKPSAAGRNNQRDLLQDDRKINVLQDGKQINPRLHVLQDDKKISPRLVPKSDRIFFDHDYPDDLEPHAKKTEFSHPYPAVQDTDEYDKDYVKDENNDKGEWKAQMDYDLLRTKVARQKDDLENAKDAEREMQKKLEEATKREAAAAKAAKEAAERAGLAKDHADGLKKRAKDKEDEEVRESKKLKNVKKAREQEEDDLFKEEEEQEQEASKSTRKESADDDSDDIDKAVANVKKEMSELKDCEKELVVARKELKEAMGKADKAAREKAAKDAAAHEKWMKDRDEAARYADLKAAQAAKYRSDHEHRIAEEEARKQALEKKEAEYAAAKKEFNQAEDTLDKTEEDMKKAADKLRSFRRTEDIGGGVSWRPRIDPKTGKRVTPEEAAQIEAEEAYARAQARTGRPVRSGTMPTSCGVTLLLPALLALFSTA